MNIHQIINARQATKKSGSMFMDFNLINKKSWYGVCEEIYKAIEGDENHIVETYNGIRVIYRKGYTAPHFIQIGNKFINPWW